MFDYRQSCTTSTGDVIHTSVIIDSQNNIFKYVPSGQTLPCTSGIWAQLSGAAVDVTDRYVLGTNNYVYLFNGGTGWTQAYSPVSGGTKAIANGPSGLFAISNTGAIVALNPI